MNVGVFLGHPAHFHYFKNTARQLQADGHQVFFAVKEKDVLRQLMDDAGFSYTIVRENRTSTSKWALIKSVLKIDWNVGRFVHDNHIDVLIGAIISYTTRIIFRKPIFIIGEDDARVVPLFSYQALPIAKYIITPEVCDNWHWEYKSIKYPANLELAYLHPNNFTPKAGVLRSYGIDLEKPYFIMRFSSLNAHHDRGIKGINTEIAQRLIDILKPYGQIYITSERPLEPQFEQYRIHINPLDMHHVMAFSSLYIGDSQTMAAEAGVLGVPFVRFNDFVGRIGYLRELEDVYELGYGIKASAPGSVDTLCKRVEEIVEMKAKERKVTFAARRERMLSEKIDCAKFLTYFIENYPKSLVETKQVDKNFWKQFK